MMSELLRKILVVSLLISTCGCASQLASGRFKCTSGPTISQEQALQIALRAKEIADRSGYELSVDQDKSFYYVSFRAKDEGKVPTFGTVAIDPCGEVITSTAPL